MANAVNAMNDLPADGSSSLDTESSILKLSSIKDAYQLEHRCVQNLGRQSRKDTEGRGCSVSVEALGRGILIFRAKSRPM